MPTMIILSHMELSRIGLPKLNSSILMEIVTIVKLWNWPGWGILFLYVLPHKCLTFWKSYLWTNLSFWYSLKITCILLRQVISLKKMVVLPVKFTILISWPPICIPLILLSALMRLASTSAAVLYNNLVLSTKNQPWRGEGAYLIKMLLPIASTSRARQSNAATFAKDKQICFMLIARTWFKAEEFRLE